MTFQMLCENNLSIHFSKTFLSQNVRLQNIGDICTNVTSGSKKKKSSIQHRRRLSSDLKTTYDLGGEHDPPLRTTGVL